MYMEQDQVVDAEAPRVAGKQPVHRRFITNEVVCHEAVVVPGLLEEAARALIEYEETLASRQQENLAIMPPSIPQREGAGWGVGMGDVFILVWGWA